ncbi:MAG: ATP-dependent DNA helicase RecG [Patescibacteria group bacterium]
MLSLLNPITNISGIGPAMAKKLATLEIFTVNDLLWHLPIRYEDYSQITPIKQLTAGDKVTIKGRVNLISARRSFKSRLTITQAVISDDTGSIKAIWFNQPYLIKNLKAGDIILLSGKLSLSNYGLQLEQPTYEPSKTYGVHTGRLVPYYSLHGLLNNHWLRTQINKVLPLAKGINDWLPAAIKNQAKIINLNQTIIQLHFPKNHNDILQARRRLAFDELYLINLQAKLARQSLRQLKSPVIDYSPDTKNFVAGLPWQLTVDQKQAAWKIIKDLGQAKPMFRLLQGDVGSGKTIVAGIAALNAVKAGWQVALVAPTEILAKQHFHTLADLFKDYPISLALLSRGYHLLNRPNDNKKTTSASIKKLLAEDKINIIVGTHSLLQKTIQWARLGFVIIDEQHRFGVEQRRYLMNQPQALYPHLLSLSATPIPRSLALSIYGDLDISLIKSMPSGRLPITTKIVEPNQRTAAYQLIKQEIAEQNRVFIICPLIEDDDEGGQKSVTTEADRLAQEVFKSIKIGRLHGKMSSQQKTEAMNNFKNGTTPILVTTTVVEVGVDVPEATIMAIEGAEHFGIAQLHQLRGRVGRSSRQSYCLLFTDQKNNLPSRLQAMVKYQNGFALAEYDLAERGPGSLLGDIQSGYFNLKYADLVNAELLVTVRNAAQYTIQTDPNFTKWPQIKQQLKNIDFHPE